MRAVPLMLSGMTRRNRHEVISGLATLVPSAGGWIVDHALFSNVAATIRSEVPSAGLARFATGLAELDVSLDAESVEALSGAAGEENGDRMLSLNLTFVHDEPDLKHPVPAVPG